MSIAIKNILEGSCAFASSASTAGFKACKAGLAGAGVPPVLTMVSGWLGRPVERASSTTGIAFAAITALFYEVADKFVYQPIEKRINARYEYLEDGKKDDWLKATSKNGIAFRNKWATAYTIGKHVATATAVCAVAYLILPHTRFKIGNVEMAAAIFGSIIAAPTTLPRDAAPKEKNDVPSGPVGKDAPKTPMPNSPKDDKKTDTPK